MKLRLSTKYMEGKRPIHVWPLSTLLKRFGIPHVRPKTGGRAMFSKTNKRSLWDIWEMVQNRWKKLRRQLHPDASNNSYERFAVMSAMYDAIILRLKQRGIG